MPVKPTIAISADKGIPKSKLDQLAKQTELPLLTPRLDTDYLLHITTEYLELQKGHKEGMCASTSLSRTALSNKKQRSKPSKAESIHVDFIGGKANHRRLHGGGKGQDIAKAIGLHKIENPTVLDLTAGMGSDAFVLATLGAEVTMVERNPIVHALLKDALERINLSADSDLQEILSRLTLKNSDSLETLNKLHEDERPDVIYLDPMFPTRSKSAQVKKEMQFFHDIVGQDIDSETLLLKALHLAKKRIVVKRPRLAEQLTDKVHPDFTITGKSTRYDVYLPKAD